MDLSDLNDQFLFLILIVCAITFIRLRNSPSPSAWEWQAVCAGIIAVSAAGAYIIPAYRGWVALAVWALFLLLPSVLSRLATRLSFSENFWSAKWLLALSGLLHPFPSFRGVATITEACYLVTLGRMTEASQLLTSLQSKQTVPAETRLLARVIELGWREDWEGIIAATAGIRDEPNLLSHRVRALGETGRLSDMLLALEAAPLPAIASVDVVALAFCGYVEDVELLFDNVLAGMTSDSKQFWLATAQMAAGREVEARRVLGELASSAKNAAIRKAAASRLAKAPGALLATLSLEDRSMLAIRRSQIPMAPLPGGSVAWRDQWVVLVLVAANIAVFVAQQVWGEEAVLLPGAFWPEGILQNGEWWRLITAAFLHAGLAHIGFNMTALLVLGPFLEKSVGHLKFAAIYFGSAIGSNAGILLLTATGVMNEELLVGASGAIFGVLGGEIVLIWQRWRAHREPAARQRLRSIALILALQVVFDLTSPQVSFSAHLFGFVSGIVLTALMFYRGFRVAPRTA